MAERPSSRARPRRARKAEHDSGAPISIFVIEAPSPLPSERGSDSMSPSPTYANRDPSVPSTTRFGSCSPRRRSPIGHTVFILRIALVLLWSIDGGQFSARDLALEPGVVTAEFIYESAPFPECHASTLAETPSGLVAAWFGGTGEGHEDVEIFVSRRRDGRWDAPTRAADGIQHDRLRYPCWNPVLWQARSGELMLFFKIGPSPRAWWGSKSVSRDGGMTWSDPVRLPEEILGPVRNKPLELADGTLLCGSSTEHDGWRVHFERTSDLGRSWARTNAVRDGKEFGAIQPTFLVHPGSRIQALCRSRQGRVVEVWSEDGGTTWGAMRATELPNPNSGIDAVTLTNGRHVLVYNPTRRGRGRLDVALSPDGTDWKTGLVLEDDDGEFSYPAVIQTKDGLVHVTYTHRRTRVRWVVLDPAKLRLEPRPTER
jgi:predicted neuraminidase